MTRLDLLVDLLFLHLVHQRLLILSYFPLLLIELAEGHESFMDFGNLLRLRLRRLAFVYRGVYDATHFDGLIELFVLYQQVRKVLRILCVTLGF